MEVPSKTSAVYTVSADGGPFDAVGSGTDAISTLALINAVLRRRLLVFGLPLALAVGVIVYGLLQPRTYVSSTSFSPQNGDPRSRLSGVAAQFGLALPATEGGQSPAFYVELATSREILDSLAAATYSVQTANGHHTGTLAEFLGVKESDPARRLDETLKRLSKAITVTRSRETSVVTVAAATHWPEVSREILERLLKALDDFNLTTRQTNARNERRFVEQQMNEAGAELRTAENQLREFLHQNRQYQQSPDLSLEYERLQRAIGFRQQVYTTLAQNFEQARADEVRDTPVLTIISHPNLPARPSSRRLLVKALIPAAVAFVLATLLAMIEALVQSRRTDWPSDIEEFIALRRAAYADLRNPLLPLRRALQRGSADTATLQ